jgi:hypothetical protein
MFLHGRLNRRSATTRTSDDEAAAIEDCYILRMMTMSPECLLQQQVDHQAVGELGS